MADNGVKKPMVRAVDRKALYLMVHAWKDGDEVQRGVFASVAAIFFTSRQTVARLYKKIHSNIQAIDNGYDGATDYTNNPALAPDEAFASGATNRRKGKYKHNRDVIRAAVKAVPIAQRHRYRHLAAKINLPKTTLYKMLKQEKTFYRNTLWLKPTLTPTVKHLRMLHALERIDPTTLNHNTRNNNCMKFSELLDEVHIDEKWFFVCNDGESYTLVTDEEEPPKRAVSHKNHICKVMFICAFARP